MKTEYSRCELLADTAEVSSKHHRPLCLCWYASGFSWMCFLLAHFPKVAFWFVCAFLSWQPTWNYRTINLEIIWKSWPFPWVHEMSVGLNRASLPLVPLLTSWNAANSSSCMLLGLEMRKDERRKKNSEMERSSVWQWKRSEGCLGRQGDETTVSLVAFFPLSTIGGFYCPVRYLE